MSGTTTGTGVPGSTVPLRSWMAVYDDLCQHEMLDVEALTTMLDGLLHSATWYADPEETELYPFLARCWPHNTLRVRIHDAMRLWSKEHRATFVACIQEYCEQAAPTSALLPQSATDLLAEDIPPPLALVEGLLHEGMIMFGGKSKRGKSWLMLDICVAVAAGRAVFRHYPVADPAKVLYIALEDGKARVQRRLRAIQPNLTTLDNLHFLYEFPPLHDGGMALLESYIVDHGFRLIVLDVLAKVEPSVKGGKEEAGYHAVYETFAPLQALRNQHPFCLVMLTHLRKADAEDVFDTLHGSVAYQGAQDVLWVLERKPKDDMAVLHLRDKDAEDKTVTLHFTEGHWEFEGEGEAFETGREQRHILETLLDEKAPMSINDLMKAMGYQTGRYEGVRKLLQRMAKEDLIYRTDRGRYAATFRAAEEVPPF